MIFVRPKFIPQVVTGGSVYERMSAYESTRARLKNATKEHV